MDLLKRTSGQRAVEESSRRYRPSNLIGVWKGVRKQRGIHHNGSATALPRRVARSRGVVAQNTQRQPEAQLRGAADAPFSFV